VAKAKLFHDLLKGFLRQPPTRPHAQICRLMIAAAISGPIRNARLETQSERARNGLKEITSGRMRTEARRRLNPHNKKTELPQL
jgi:hypothetical protein